MLHLAGGQRGLLDLDELAGWQRSREHLAACASARVLLDGKLVVVETDSFRELAVRASRCAGLRLGHHAAHRRKGRESYKEFTSVEIVHGEIVRGGKCGGHLLLLAVLLLRVSADLN